MYEQFSDHVLVMDEKNNVHSLDILDRNSNTRELIPFTQDFRIHGFDIYHDDLNPTELTFMFVNHQRSGSGISIFKHQLNTTFIEHIKTVKSPLLYHPNDVAATSRSTFYATNDLKYAPGIMRRIEILLGMPWSHVVYYGPSGMFSKAKTGLAYPNGIARSRDGRLIYVAASSEPSVMAFLASDDGELELVAKKVFDGFVPDNISVDARSGHLLVAGFLNVFEMFRYNREVLHGTNARPASSIRRLSLLHSSSSKITFTEKNMLTHDGTLLPSTTMAVVQRRNNIERILLGSVMADHIAICNQ
ncbi:hypothetical protein GGF37_002988 [Kickxella alabastrina]|nr:hypothetical protein GGF37_002988 [Kickxella alabastrina]